MTHVIRYPGGRIVPLTREQFQTRIQLSDSQRAVQWAVDMQGELSTNDGDVALEFHAENSQQTQLPEASSITRLKLTNAREISSPELSYLIHLHSLLQLDLAGSSVSTLSAIDTLTSLRTLNLSETKVVDVENLRHLANLEDLNLASTLIDASSGDVLSSLTKLKVLNLSGTAVNSLTIQQIKSLQQLKKLNLTGTSLSADSVDSIRKALANTEILWSVTGIPE